jgi:hypothetical protein
MLFILFYFLVPTDFKWRCVYRHLAATRAAKKKKQKNGKGNQRAHTLEIMAAAEEHPAIQLDESADFAPWPFL